MTYECCICSKRLSTGNPRTFYCSSCYKLWKDAIENKEEWVIFLQNNERQRRRWGTFMQEGKIEHVEFVYLSDKFDVGDNGKLIPTKAYYDEVN